MDTGHDNRIEIQTFFRNFFIAFDAVAVITTFDASICLLDLDKELFAPALCGQCHFLLLYGIHA